MQIRNIFITHPITLLLFGIGISLLIIPVYSAVSTEKTISVEESSLKAEGESYHLTKGTVPLRVSGVISSTNEVTIRAQTSGTIEIRVEEGNHVDENDILAQQQLPVTEAQLALSSSQRKLNATQQQLNTEQAQVLLKKQKELASNATSLIGLRTTNNTNRISETRSGLLTTLESSTLLMVQALDYIDNNRSFFTAEGMRQYRDLVAMLYNQHPDYLSGGIIYSIKSSEDLLSLLHVIQQEKDLTSTQTILDLADRINQSLRLITEILRTGEDTVYNERVVTYSGYEYGKYTSTRSSVLAAQGDLIIAITALRGALDASNEDILQQKTAVSTTALDQEYAKTFLQHTKQIALNNDEFSLAQGHVYEAQLSLATVRAPFPGVISDIMVESGEYVTNGTPVLSLHGTRAQEVTVSIPAKFMNTVEVGQALYVDDTIVGYVDHFAPIASLGSVQVTISLQNSNFISGETLTGVILLEEENTDIYRVPRKYVLFNNTGPYIQYGDTETSPIVIVYDSGDYLYAKVETVSDKPLSCTEIFSPPYGK